MEFLKVKINSPEKIIFEGDVVSVSSQNSQGEFSILPFHASFITLIENRPIYLRTTTGETLNFKFERSVLYTRQNEVRIYTHF